MLKFKTTSVINTIVDINLKNKNSYSYSNFKLKLAMRGTLIVSKLQIKNKINLNPTNHAFSGVNTGIFFS